MPEYVDFSRPATGVWKERVMCRQAHPDNPQARCAKFTGHPGNHAAFVFSTVIPQEWAAQ